MNLGQIIFAFVFGLILAYVYVKTDDIKTTILLHLLNNGYATLQLLITSGIAINIMYVMIFCGMAIGFISFLSKCLRERKNLKLKIDKDEIKNYKYIFTEYTFVVSMIIVFLMFAYTENILRIG